MPDPAPPGQKYGWTSVAFDDERMDAPFDSVEDALANAVETIEEEAPDREWDSGTHEVAVDVSRVSLYNPFFVEGILDYVIDRMGDDGFEEPDEALHLHTSARNTLRDALQAAWDAHVEREKVPAYYEATHGPTHHKVTVTIKAEE